MNIILTTGIVLIIISLLAPKKYAPWLGFAFVLMIMGFQDNVQGDYYAYKEMFENILRTGISGTRTGEREPFLPLVMLFFSWMPWRLFILLLSLLEMLVLGRFVAVHVAKKYQFAAAILFFFTFNMMLMQMKVIRQGLAIEMMVMAFLLLDNKKAGNKIIRNRKIPWLSLLLAILAYLTHNTSLLLLPFLFIYWRATRKPEIMDQFGNGTFFPIVMTGLFVFMVLIKDIFLSDYLPQLAISFSALESGYSGYLDGSNKIESVQYLTAVTPMYLVLFNGIMVYIISTVYQNSNTSMRIFCLISILSLICEMLFFNLGSLQRIVMHFSIVNIVVYPNVLFYIRNRFGDAAAIGLFFMILVVAARISLEWMLDTTAGDRFGTYKFIFMN